MGKVMELNPLPSADVEIIEGDFIDPVRGYKIEGNYSIELTKENTYHHKLFNPNWFREKTLHGMSPLRAAAKTVSKLNQIEITEAKGFENQGPPYLLFKKSKGGTVNPADRMSDAQRDTMTKAFKKASNENNRGLPLVTKDEMGKLDLGQTFADLKTVESSDAGMIALCNVYAFPPELAGYGQKTYSNMGTARKAAWTDCIMPNMKAIEDTFNHCLIDPVAGYANSGIRFKFDYSEVEELAEGMKDKVDWMNAAGLSGNEIWEAVNQPRVENPLMDEPRISMGTGFISDYGEPLDDDKSFEDYLNKK
jgi:phage portal protein BeeE